MRSEFSRLLACGGLLALIACGPTATAPTAPPTAATRPAPEPSLADPAQSSPGAALRSMAELPKARPGQEEVILATTTSTQDSGLLEVLVPMFERQTGYRVKTIAVGTGQSLALGLRGEADVVLVHAPEAERQQMAAGNGTERLLVMHNDFVLVGPPDDPARIRGETSAEGAFGKIAQAQAPFISRGDDSGTHKQELAIWNAAGLHPQGNAWYQEAGQGMGATLNIANEKRAYTLTDRGTYLARKGTLQLDLLVEGAKALLNVYHVMPVNPRKFPRVNAAGGQAFAQFMVSREAQDVIATFGRDRYGQPLFFPDAGKRDEEVGG